MGERDPKADLEWTERVEAVECVAWALILQLNWALDCLMSANNMLKDTGAIPPGAAMITKRAIGHARDHIEKAKEVLGDGN